MLHEFITTNRDDLIARCRAKVVERFGTDRILDQIGNGVPLFLEQLADTLRLEQHERDGQVAGKSQHPDPADIGRGASLHGTELLRLGYRVDQVVHEYGDICQAVTELAVAQHAPISNDEFHTLNRCLDNAIADAVTSFGSSRQILMDEEQVSLQQRLGFLFHEQERLVDIALHSLSAIKTGHVGLTGATGTLLTYALEELRALPNRIQTAIRPTSVLPAISTP
jgi:hypothetical protein